MTDARTVSFETEQSVIGGLLLDNDAIDRIGDLRAEHFAGAEHRLIFGAIVAMIGAGKPADVITVLEDLRTRQSDRDGLASYLNSLAQNTPSAANIVRYSEIVRDRAIKRGLLDLGAAIEPMVTSSSDSAATILDVVGSRLEALAESRVSGDPIRVSDDLPAHLELLAQRAEGLVEAIPTGFADVDKMLSGGIRPGDLILLGGRPGTGKTAFSMNVATCVAQEHTVLFLSMEMPRSQLHDRNIAALGRVALSLVLETQNMTDTEGWPHVAAAAQRLQDLNLYTDAQGGLRLLDVRMKARRVKRRYGLDLLVIDYLQLMEGQGDNRNAQIETITRGLKALAKELDIGILLLSQLNRKLEERPDKRPHMSDLRDSGSIEQDADVVLFLYRDEVYNPDTHDKGLCEVIVAKNRQGALGRVALAYVADQVRFDSLDRRWQPAPPASKAVRRPSMADGC